MLFGRCFGFEMDIKQIWLQFKDFQKTVGKRPKYFETFLNEISRFRITKFV